jgi:hypothetical protein
MKQRFNFEGQAFLYRIVAIDETWVKDFEPELKSQSNDWRSQNSARPQKFRQGQTKVKQMLIFLMITEQSSRKIELHLEQV